MGFNEIIIVGLILFAAAIVIAFTAFKVSIEEVQLLRQLNEEDQKRCSDDTVRGSAWSAVLGATLAGGAAAVIIGLYGVGPGFLYLGPLVALAASIGVMVCFFSDIRDRNEVRNLLVCQREAQARSEGGRGPQPAS